MGSNSPSIRELALAALARQRGDGGTRHGTSAGQGVSRPANATDPHGTPFIESNQTPSRIVPLSHSLGRETVGHCENFGTARGTLAGQSSGFLYAEALRELESECPEYVEAARWQQAIHDAVCFMSKWGRQAQVLGWTAQELFGLHEPPSKPHASYSRLSRYDATGLIWLLRGRPAVALTDTTATISTPSGGTVTYRKHRKPALGPLGDSLDDFGTAV